jgi:hypothetical protein
LNLHNSTRNLSTSSYPSVAVVFGVRALKLLTLNPQQQRVAKHLYLMRRRLILYHSPGHLPPILRLYLTQVDLVKFNADECTTSGTGGMPPSGRYRRARPERSVESRLGATCFVLGSVARHGAEGPSVFCQRVDGFIVCAFHSSARHMVLMGCRIGAASG